LRPTRYAQVIIVTAAVFLFAALLLDDPAFLLCAASLLALLAIFAAAFYIKSKKLIGSLSVTRNLERSITYQGVPCRVEITVQCRIPSDMIAYVSEILPLDVEPERGIADFSIPKEGTTTFAYNLIPYTYGTLRFSGICLDLSDLFYRVSVELTAPAYAGPDLLVRPVPYFGGKILPMEYGEQEIQRISLFKGKIISGFRGYVQKDDIKFVDWKLSAKHEKLIVREYSGAEKMPALIIVDLPERTGELENEAFERLISRVTVEVTRAYERHGAASLMIISGINILGVLIYEQKLQRCIAFISEHAHPQRRLEAAYRIPTRANIRKLELAVRQQVHLERTDTVRKNSLLCIEQVLSRVAPCYETPVFYIQCLRLLKKGFFSEVEVYSMLSGDLSHMRLLISAARHVRLETRVFFSGSYDKTERGQLARHMGVTSIEVIP